jgi:hypothetical protein
MEDDLKKTKKMQDDKNKLEDNLKKNEDDPK